MLWRDGEIQLIKYWDVSFAKTNEEVRSEQDYIAEWGEMFRTSVRLRLMADVPLGMFLSGGIDSSAIAAVMSGMVDEPIKTFSVAFAEREANELEYARIVARAFRSEEVRSEQDYIAEWGEMFRTSVRLRLMADVPLGMFLSGGIDSSAIAAVMSGMVNEPIKTFSVAFAEREENELEYARIVAEAYKTNHHEIVVSPEQFFEALPKLVWHEDEPLAHPSSVALYFVSHLAAQHVKVVLTGEGSDELLAGYWRYRRTIWNLALGQRYKQFTPSIARDTIRKQIERMMPGGRMRQKLMRTFLVLSPELESIYFDNFAVFPAPMQQH